MGKRGKFRGFDRNRRWARARAYQPKPPRRAGGGLGRYSTLWLGAVFVGLAYGSGNFTAPSSTSTAAEPIAYQGSQAPRTAIVDPADRSWEQRGASAGAPSVDAAAERVDEGVRGAGVRASFGLCHSGGGTNCVVDGDTIWLGGENIRVADIDAPETHEPRCAEEQALGDRATARLHELVNNGTVTLTPIDRDEDSYGRKLRIVRVDGTSVGETLVSEGLARWYEGGRRGWCG